MTEKLRPFELGPCLISDGQRGWSMPHHLWTYVSASRNLEFSQSGGVGYGGTTRVVLLCQRCAVLVYREIEE